MRNIDPDAPCGITPQIGMILGLHRMIPSQTIGITTSGKETTASTKGSRQ